MTAKARFQVGDVLRRLPGWTGIAWNKDTTFTVLDNRVVNGVQIKVRVLDGPDPGTEHWVIQERMILDPYLSAIRRTRHGQ